MRVRASDHQGRKAAQGAPGGGGAAGVRELQEEVNAMRKVRYGYRLVVWAVGFW